MQQLGRGLRLASDKECCTVLDFVGNARAEYDFAQKFRLWWVKPIRRSATRSNRAPAPWAAASKLSKQTQELILSNIKRRPRIQLQVQFPIKNQAAFEVRQNHLKSQAFCAAKFSRLPLLSPAKSLPLGTYCRSRPLLFSFCPRSHALYGCAKYTCASSSAATRSCSTNSLPLSAVMVWTCLVGFQHADNGVRHRAGCFAGNVLNQVEPSYAPTDSLLHRCLALPNTVSTLISPHGSAH